MNYSTKDSFAPVVKGIFGLVVILCTAFLPLTLSANNIYQAMLRGRHEVLPVTTPASGMITATLEENVLTVEGSFSGLSGDFASNVAGGSHIHIAYAGRNGGIALSLTATLDPDLRGGTFRAQDNNFSLTEEQMQALAERRMYVNIHSTASTSGELRGQLLPAAEEYFFTNLLGSNAVPAVMSGGSGALALELNGRTLTVSGSFQNMEGTLFTQAAGGAHLHLGYAGETGGIEVGLNPSAGEDGNAAVFTAADNTFELTPPQVRALRDRRLYANIHSSQVPGGELRGQVVGMARNVFRAHLSGSNENPSVTSLATGVVLAELMADNRLILSGNFNGLESKLAVNTGGGAHIHRGLAGSNGPVMFRIFVKTGGGLLNGVVEMDRNINELSEEQVAALYDRAFYANFHTLINGSGEIRGQLLPESQMYFSGFLSSIFQTNGAISTGTGGVKAELSGNRLTLSGSFAELRSAVATEIAGGAHIHRGMAGSNGPVTQPLVLTLGDDSQSGTFAADQNVFELEAAELEDLRARGKYVNIHSLDNPSGELRTQLLPEATTYFVAPLSGASQTVPVNTDAVGMTILEVTGNIGITTGSFNNLSAPLATAISGGAHVHQGMAGQNGSVIFPLNSSTEDGMLSGTFAAEDNVQALNKDFISRLRSRGYYVNVHSQQYLPGEIRGQLLPLATAYFTANLAGSNAVPPNASMGRGQVKVELRGTEIVLSGAFSGLTGEFDAAVAGGSHLHAAFVGQNGPIKFFTNARLNEDLKGGRFLAVENVFDLDFRNYFDLINGFLYLNIHSSTHPAGEIRGHVLGEINQYPEPDATITSPMPGETLTVEGDPLTDFILNWTPATDRDYLGYVWQVSTGVAFQTLLLNRNVGYSDFYATNYALLDKLLANAGVAVGETVTLFHRIVASDGSLATAGPTSNLTLTRGVLDPLGGSRIALPGNDEEVVADFRVFPNLLRSGQLVNVQVMAGADQRALLVLVNQLGQPLQRRPVELFAGENRMEWSLPDLAAGFYFIQLQMEGQLLPLQRIVVN
ncbi:CHRD domain-containing protein [Flavilitoribacter nigricans]|uniref:CHRD domain-containing protein n=1 Tax=Flavilitoribacter nigricans (strain ATCC 23147 / DSM 23189 / NBRC 102662 / NCIMB 1420 / SS-2) TaxID=1122177 RepID=A0A2D0NHT4_FLAN2|nr:CHRD domain-containing protein [Flavilitoribacter nigricans]PHN07940.1 hypothetical protein CRP01_04070 [Flavilitoribacter nigricans DSM 23189 = NBRC 102662]